jgi:peptide methionine sulfoxide reductase msrA/msrB
MFKLNPRITIPLLLGMFSLGFGCPVDDRHNENSPTMTKMDDKTDMTSSHSDSGYDLTPPGPKEKAAMIAQLTPEQRRITQASGTEAAFCGTLLDNKRDGMYVCVVCGLPLFKSSDKFNSETGWPSFTLPFDREHVAGRIDSSLGMDRNEIVCARCEAHLGHVFEDGPEPSGLRFCLNSEALKFHDDGIELPQESRQTETATAYFAGGCFWGVEYAFGELPGVYNTSSGYQNGTTESPDYRSVCSGETGHAESVRVRYDPKKIDYETLVRFFYRIHDPTTLNRQGPDVGTQYRSAIFTTSDEQKEIAEKVTAEVTASDDFDKLEVVTVIEPAGEFHDAEAYHQDYVDRTGRACHSGIGSAIAEFQEKLGASD